MTVGELFVKLTLDDKGFSKGVGDAEKKTGILSGKLGATVKAVAGMGAAVTAGGAALYGMATKAANATDRIDKMSQKFGMSREGFQEWDFILSQSGTSIDSMGAGMKSLINNLDGLGSGATGATDKFGRLGLSFEDFQGLNAEQSFEKVVVALQQVEDETERAALANQLLGRSGMELMPLLNAGAGSIDEMKEAARELGLVMGDEAIDAGVAFTDMMDQLKRSFGTVATEVGVALMPALVSFGEFVIAKMPEIKQVMSVVFGVIEKVVTAVVNVFNEYMLPVLELIFDWVADNMPVIQSVFDKTFTTIRSIIELFAVIVTKIWNAYGEDMLKIITIAFTAIMKVIDSTLSLIKGIVDFFISLLTGDWKNLSTNLQTIWESMWRIIRSIVEGAWGMMQGAFNMLFNSIQTWFQNLPAQAMQWGRNMIQGFIDGINNMIGAVGNAVSNVTGTVGKWLGFRSPSEKGEGRFITQWGENMIGGFMDGIENAIPALQSTLDSVIPAMGGSGATQNNFGGVTVQNMTVRNDSDIELVARRLYDLQTRTGRGLGIV